MPAIVDESEIEYISIYNAFFKYFNATYGFSSLIFKKYLSIKRTFVEKYVYIYQHIVVYIFYITENIINHL